MFEARHQNFGFYSLPHFKTGPIVYWMSRDQRINDNWAFIRSAELAALHDTSVHVAFCLTKSYPDATRRAYDFMVILNVSSFTINII